MQVAGLPKAPLLIAAEDVKHGKPNPGGFQLAAEKLGKFATASIVFENSPSGLDAGQRAGCRNHPHNCRSEGRSAGTAGID